MQKLFILGCPRSGTTMVQQALNRHAGIIIPPETKFFFSFVGQSRRNQARHLDRIRKDLGIALPDPRRPIVSAPEIRAFYEDIGRRYRDRLQKSMAVYFGDKTPEHTSRLHDIRMLFPDSKIIFFFRDGRDVALSLTKVPWMSRDLFVNFLVWRYYYRTLMQARAGGWSNVYFARYEDIVAAPEREFANMLDFLELPYEPAVALGHGNREGVPDREYSWKWRALDKVTPARVGVFRQELNEEQIGILERIGKNALRVLGYPLVTRGDARITLRFLCRLSWEISKLVLRVPASSTIAEFLGPPFPLARRFGFPSSASARMKPFESPSYLGLNGDVHTLAAPAPPPAADPGSGAEAVIPKGKPSSAL